MGSTGRSVSWAYSWLGLVQGCLKASDISGPRASLASLKYSVRVSMAVFAQHQLERRESLPPDGVRGVQVMLTLSMTVAAVT